MPLWMRRAWVLVGIGALACMAEMLREWAFR
jgi:hypothetical protein